MNDSSIKILSTKKLLSNQRQFLLNANFSLIEADFIKIEFSKVDLKTTFDFLIFTRQNAVKSVLNHENWNDLKSKKFRA